MARSGSNKTTVSVDAPIMIVTDGTPVWHNEEWPMLFFGWLKENKFKLKGLQQCQGHLKLTFVDPKTSTLFRLKYDEEKIFRTKKRT